MARPIVIRDLTIIDAARDVFLERGFRATTAEVAERAGVSEGSIFKRFKTKFELFQAAMGSAAAEPAIFETLAAKVGRGDVQANLYDIGMGLVAHFTAVVPLMMMAWSNPNADGLPCAMNEPNPPPVRMLKKLGGFFDAEIRAGRMRHQDPEIIARTFLGSIHNFIVLHILLKNHEELPMPAETFIRGLVQLVWVGVAPASTAAPGRGRAPSPPKPPAS